MVKGDFAIQETTNRKNLLLLVALRWVAVVGQVAAIGFAVIWLGIDLPIADMGCVLVFLIGLNLATLMRARSGSAVSNLELLVELLLDVLALSVQLYLSGGAPIRSSRCSCSRRSSAPCCCGHGRPGRSSP